MSREKTIASWLRLHVRYFISCLILETDRQNNSSLFFPLGFPLRSLFRLLHKTSSTAQFSTICNSSEWKTSTSGSEIIKIDEWMHEWMTEQINKWMASMKVWRMNVFADRDWQCTEFPLTKIVTTLRRKSTLAAKKNWVVQSIHNSNNDTTHHREWQLY